MLADDKLQIQFASPNYEVFEGICMTDKSKQLLP